MDNTTAAALTHFTLREFEGKPLTNATPVSRVVRTHGAKAMTLRFNPGTVAGTFAIRFLRPDKVTEYSTNQPADVPVVASTPARIQVADTEGVQYVKITFTPSVTATFVFADVSFGWQ